MKTISAFTKKENKIANCLQTTILVSQNKKIVEKDVITKKYIAIWDTGATNTAITPKVAHELKLIPITKTKTNTANGIKECNVYIVDLLLPNNVTVSDVLVTEANLGEGADLLIGMDIITKGDFCVSNYNGKTTMTFRMPSIIETDYVKLYNSLTPTKTKKDKIGRNEPCPCGSGKKYKNCCGK